MKKCPICNNEIIKDDLSIDYHCSKCGNYKMDFGFISKLNNFEMRYPKYYHQVIELVKEYINKNNNIYFTENYERVEPFFNKTIIELEDITNKIGIDITSNSCGSDYGD